MDSLNLQQSASLLGVDLFFIEYYSHKLSISDGVISDTDLCRLMEQVLLKREQYWFLGHFAMPSEDEKCFIFKVKYNIHSRVGNICKISSVFESNVRLSPQRNRIYVTKEKVWLTNCGHNWNHFNIYDDHWHNEAARDEIGGKDYTDYYIIVSKKVINLEPRCFHPSIRRGTLVYEDYGKATDMEIIESHANYDIAIGHPAGYFILDKQGLILSHFYNHIQCDKEGGIWASMKSVSDSGRCYAFYNKYAEICSSPRFDSLRKFSEGLCAVSAHLGGYIGFIDMCGNLVIDHLYGSASDFQNGVSKVGVPCSSNDYGYIDVKGRAVTKEGVVLLSKTGESYSLVPIRNDKYHAKDGSLFSLSGERLRYRMDYGTGSFILPFVGIADDGLMGFLNHNCDIVVPLRYKRVGAFYNGVAMVITEKNKDLFIDEHNHNYSIDYSKLSDNDVAQIKKYHTWLLKTDTLFTMKFIMDKEALVLEDNFGER